MTAQEAARKVTEGSIVLLKNEEGLLPLKPGAAAAFFGRAQVETALSGNGSGAARTENPQSILGECERAGLIPTPALKEFYESAVEEYTKAHPADFDFSKLKEVVNSGLMYEIFGKYTPPAEEFEVPEELLAESREQTDTAVLVIGRSSGGEECDRHLENDYYLSDVEQNLVSQVCGSFPKVILILNINGLIDLSWVERHPQIKSVLFLGVPGEQGPAALANLLCGRVSPSGKLSVTIGRRYEDYPAARDFSWDKDHPEKILTYEDYGLSAAENGSIGFDRSPVDVYREDIYPGYRYFDTFGVKPLYPFGFGLSYTQFAISGGSLEKRPGGAALTATVKNTGSFLGREVLQVYLSAFGVKSPRPAQELKGFAKTRELAPGESETVSVMIPWTELACYDEEQAAWVIESGTYQVRLGNSSASTRPVGTVTVRQEICVLQTKSRLGLRPCNAGKLDFLRAPLRETEELQGTAIELTPADVQPLELQSPPAEDCSALTDSELAALCVGFGPGIPFAAMFETEDPLTITDENGEPLTSNDHPTGFNGYVSPAIERHGIHSVFYKDGPAGVGLTAWPSEMLLACSFDRELCRLFGDAVGRECEKLQVNVWLAPALNLHRHPLGGRNFEYLSEDPFLTGACACALADGVQTGRKVLVCAKHFAVNEQETYRRGSGRAGENGRAFDAVDSVLTERCVREIYLKPFEMLVRASGLRCMMTSFNKINGTFAGGNKDLCTHILREEWGFDGAVVTDWGDMDVVVDGADAVAAGNDVVMPGGPPVIAQILKGFEEGRVTRAELETAVGHLRRMLRYAGR